MTQLNSSNRETEEERLQNMFLRFEDQQVMIHQNQKRIEELFELLKETDKRVMKFSSFEQTVESKLDMVMEGLDSIRKGKDFKQGGSGGSDGKDDNDGGSTMQDKYNQKRAIEMIEDLTKNFGELEKEIKSLKSQFVSMNGILSMIQSELTFKVDKEAHEQALDTKLDREEFYAKGGDSGISDEMIKKMEMELLKNNKKTESLLDEHAKKIKKLKKRIEHLEAGSGDMEKNMKDLMETMLKEGVGSKNQVGVC